MPYFYDDPRTVINVAALSKLDIADGTYVRTLGFYSAGDGGGNEYLYDATSSASVNHGKILPGIDGEWSFDASGNFDGVAGTGRFIATNESSATPQQFGAQLGGANDTFAAQRIIDEELVLELPKADYMFANLSLIDGAQIQAHQEADIAAYPDNTATIMVATSGNRQGIRVSGGKWRACATVLDCTATAVEVSLVDMFFEANTDATVTGDIFSLYAHDCIWRGCTAPAFACNISVSSFNNCRFRSFSSTTRPIFEFGTVNNLRLQSCWIEDNDSATAVVTGSASNLVLANCYFESNIETAGTWTDMITVQGAGNVRLKDCLFAGHNQNIFTGAVVKLEGDCSLKVESGKYLIKRPQKLVSCSGNNDNIVLIDKPLIDHGAVSGGTALSHVIADTTTGLSTLPEQGTVTQGTGPGGVGNARVFDGSSYFIGGTGDINPEDRAYAVFQFVNFNAKSGTPTISGKWRTNGTMRQFVLWYISSEIRLYVSSDGSSSNQSIVATGVNPTLSTWYPMMYYFDPIADKIGVIISGTDYSTAYRQPYSADGAHFGIGDNYGASGGFDGSIARVACMLPTPGVAGADGYSWSTIFDYLDNSGEGRSWADVHSVVRKQWGIRNYWNLDEASGDAIDSAGVQFEWRENPADIKAGVE